MFVIPKKDIINEARIMLNTVRHYIYHKNSEKTCACMWWCLLEHFISWKTKNIAAQCSDGTVFCKNILFLFKIIIKIIIICIEGEVEDILLWYRPTIFPWDMLGSLSNLIRWNHLIIMCKLITWIVMWHRLMFII